MKRRAISLVVLLVLLTGALQASANATSSPPVAAAASRCATSTVVIYGRYGVSCTKAKQVVRRFLAGGGTPSGWSCSLRRRQCNGSGLSIDEYRGFNWRYR